MKLAPMGVANRFGSMFAITAKNGDPVQLDCNGFRALVQERLGCLVDVYSDSHSGTVVEVPDQYDKSFRSMVTGRGYLMATRQTDI